LAGFSARFLRKRKVLPIPNACIAAIGTALPDHDIHTAFLEWAEARMGEPRKAALFRRMANRSGIRHRWSVLPKAPAGGSPVCEGGFYAEDVLPPTSERMRLYETHAPALAMAAIEALSAKVPLDGISHIVVASCTGFTAPGIDQIIADRLGLAPSVERLLVGFMGCYAAITALRSARHIVRSDPAARVLVVTVELSTLHLQDTSALEPLLAMLQFGDGAAAALVTAAQPGLAIDRPFALSLPDSQGLIRWEIGDQGFAMHLSGEVPGRIAEAFKDPAIAATLTGGAPVDSIDGWAVHAGGRSILDAVEHGLGLSADALTASRSVLEEAGNMSSATLMFALAKLIPEKPANGIALAFGPGLAAEGFGFHWEA
jgi:predicted naringenin-chalcone synthase